MKNTYQKKEMKILFIQKLINTQDDYSTSSEQYLQSCFKTIFTS